MYNQFGRIYTWWYSEDNIAIAIASWSRMKLPVTVNNVAKNCQM